MKKRDIDFSYSIDRTHWVGDGFRVNNYFPSGRNILERFSPFIMMDYASPFEFVPSMNPRGVGAHPHRGFETVSFAIEGAVEHHDNKGNHGIIYPGDVQWMTAGSGLLHQEYIEKEFNQKGGVVHFVQLWVNLPKKHKMTQPKYQSITKEEMGVYSNDGVTASILAGELKGIKGPASTFTPMNIYTLALKQGSKITLDEPKHYHVGLLVLAGKLTMNDQSFKHKDFIVFKETEGIIELEALEDSKILILSGEPIDEPIAAYGPFVMNTMDEIRQANQDFHAGKFGPFEF